MGEPLSRLAGAAALTRRGERPSTTFRVPAGDGSGQASGLPCLMFDEAPGHRGCQEGIAARDHTDGRHHPIGDRSAILYEMTTRQRPGARLSEAPAGEWGGRQEAIRRATPQSGTPR